MSFLAGRETDRPAVPALLRFERGEPGTGTNHQGWVRIPEFRSKTLRISVWRSAVG
jgi:hypothetical protein